MKKSFFFVIAVLCFCLHLNAQQTTPNSGIYYAPMTINNVSAWYSSNGGQEITHGAPKVLFGATYPRNTSSVVFTSGFLYSADAPQPVVNGAYYSKTLQQGAILGIQTGVAEDKLSADVRIWRIRKDFTTADLRRDAAETFGLAENAVSIMDMQRLRIQYKKDWVEWPAGKGAPYYDVNKNGLYDPKFTANEFGVEIPDTNSDSPGVADADQVIWYVCNDLGGNSPWGTQSIGLEMQFTIWGYKTDGALANTIFRRCRLVYKGKSTTPALHTLANMYIGVWSDIDLGQPIDDLAGSDSLSGLGFVYNSRVLDGEYSKFNIVPPSVGYDILQGPTVKGTNQDSALVNFSYRKGFKNLPVTSITYSSQSNSTISIGNSGISQLTNALKGLPTRVNTPKIDPMTLQPTKFWASGDPVLKTGWIDGMSESASDRSILISSGPFTMALGDTQDVVTAFIAAHSQDRLASVNVLKYYDKIIQDAYSQLVSLPPSLPPTKATLTEFDRTLLIEWEKDTAGMNQTEKFSSKGYVFEGYTLYQFSSPTTPRNEWKKIATYDIKNDITQIVQENINTQSGRVELQVKQEGKNSGIIRYLILTHDSIRNSPLINGQEYHFALTSYAYTSNTNALARTIESEPQVLHGVPHQSNPETSVPYAIKDSLLDLGENIIGHNDGRIGLRILNPYSVSGGIYDIWYGLSGANVTWTLIKNIAGTEYATIKTKLTAYELPVPQPSPLPTSTGTASFTLNDARDRIAFSVDVSTQSIVTSVELHMGPKNSAGSMVKILGTNAKSVSGVWTFNDPVQPLTDTLIKDFIAGYMYVLVRSTQYPNGEVRGQLFDGLIPRVNLPIPDFSTSERSVLTFAENRLPGEGFSLYVSPAPIGYKSGEQIAPTRSNVVNVPNQEGTYFLVGPGFSWGGYNHTESTIEFRFTGDTNWAIITAPIPAETKFIRVPFQVYQDSVRVWPVIANAIPSDSVWDIKGNVFQNGKPTFDKIVGIVNKTDPSGNDISYYGMIVNGVLPSRNALRGRLINGVNHIAKNIVFVNVKNDGIPPAAGTQIQITPFKWIKYGDVKRFTLRSVQQGNKMLAQQQISRINIFPNPYYGVNSFENSSSGKYVTISHLPEKATIKIFNIAGIHVKTLHKDDPDQFLRWDLRNEKGFFIASGLYIIYIDMKGIGTTTLKFAVIMEDLNLNSF